MPRLAAKIKSWWHGTTVSQPVPFQIDCACGHKLAGPRRATHQVVQCPSCGLRRFVFPLSRLPAVPGAHGTGKAYRARRRLQVVATLGLVVVGLALLYVWVLNPRNGGLPAPEKSPLAQRLRQAERALQTGQFRIAADELTAALPELASLPQAERVHYTHLAREAALLADLCGEALEEIVRHAGGTAEAEWHLDFAHRFRGKAILFDTVVQADGRGGFRLVYPLKMRDEEVALEVSDLKLLKQLDLEQSRRVLFGVRLASVRLEAPGPRWVVRFEPDSGVLLTDAEAAARCCPPWGDDDTRALLARQRRLIAERTGTFRE